MSDTDAGRLAALLPPVLDAVAAAGTGYRVGDLLGTWIPALLALVALPAAPVAMGFSAAWLWGGWKLGSRWSTGRPR